MSALGGQVMADYGWAYGEHRRRLFAFSLDGSQSVPVSAPPRVPRPLASSDFIVNEDLASQGATAYAEICVGCHGFEAVASGMAPDLRASGIILSSEAFEQAVRGGARASRGMPTFTDVSDAELNALRHYIREQAEVALTAER